MAAISATMSFLSRLGLSACGASEPQHGTDPTSVSVPGAQHKPRLSCFAEISENDLKLPPSQETQNIDLSRTFLKLDLGGDADGAWCPTQVDADGDLNTHFNLSVYVKIGSASLQKVPRSSLEIDDDNDFLIRVPSQALGPATFIDFLDVCDVPEPVPDGWYEHKYRFKAGYGWLYCLSGSWQPVAMPWLETWSKDFICIFKGTNTLS